MARDPKPWFRTAQKTWFVNINGKRYNLGRDEKEAKKRFHELMAGESPAAPQEPDTITIAEIFEKFLAWCENHRSPGTYEWSRFRIQLFIRYMGKMARSPFSELKPFHVVEWLDTNSQWGETYKHGLVAAVQRPFNWAMKLGYIDKNPIQFVEKPGVKRREQVVTPEVWQTIRDHYPLNDPFRDLLEFAWECGCRPQEARKLEARHLQLQLHRARFPKEESKGGKHPRIIYMTPRAEEIINRLLAQNSYGPLFRNAEGNPWTTYAMNCRFCQLQIRTGRKRMEELGIPLSKAKDPKIRKRENNKLAAEHGVKFAAYSLRHGFATKLLEDGIDHLTVAALMGHVDGTQVARVYGHLEGKDKYLHAALNGKGSIRNVEVPENCS